MVGAPELSREAYTQFYGGFVQAIADGGFEPLSEQDVASVTRPTLVMTGSTSPAVLRLLAKRLDELLPHSRIVDIPDASHVMHVQNPAAANAAIVDFLRP
ncbi:hypothetical protein GCM10027449_03690 [Sinomonas notoginsengisoli]